MGLGLPLHRPWILYMIHQEGFQFYLFYIGAKEKGKVVFDSCKPSVGFSFLEIYVWNVVFFPITSSSLTLKTYFHWISTVLNDYFEFSWKICCCKIVFLSSKVSVLKVFTNFKPMNATSSCLILGLGVTGWSPCLCHIVLSLEKTTWTSL